MTIVDLPTDDDSDVPDDWQNMVEELCELSEGLSNWEVEFVESLSHRSALTWKQYNKLKEIYERKIR